MRSSRRSSRFAAALLAASALAALPGCGGGSADPPATNAPTAQIREFAVPVSGNVPGDPHPGSWPDDLVMGQDGSLWFGEHHADEVGRMVPSGGGYTYQGYPVPTHNAGMDSVALDQTRHRLWVSENAGNKIVRLDLTTSPPQVTEFTVATNAMSDPVPGDLALSVDGSPWFTSPYEVASDASRDSLGRLDPATGQAPYFQTPTGTNGMDGISVAGDGSVWFVELASNQIGRYAQGRFTEFRMPRPGVGPTNIALDAGGRVWVTEQAANAVAVLDPADTSGQPWHEIPMATPGSDPVGIAIDGTGNVWLTESTAGRIGLVPAGSTNAVDFATPTPDSFPEDVIAAPNGHVYFTERYGNKVGELTLNH